MLELNFLTLTVRCWGLSLLSAWHTWIPFMPSVLTVWDTLHLPRSTHYSFAQMLFLWSHTGWNTLWWSYLTSPGWPTCEGVWKMTLRPQSIRSYRVFVDAPAVRENERGFGRARHTVGDQWAAVQLISVPYVVSIGAVERPCHPCGRKGMQEGSGRGRNCATCTIYSTYIYSGKSIKEINLTPNSKKREHSR